MKENNTTVVNPIRSTNFILNNTLIDNIIKKFNEDILTQNEFEYLKEIAIKNQIGLVSYINKKTGMRFRKIKIVENNENFQKLLYGINFFKIQNPFIKFDYFFDVLTVTTNNKKETTFHNVIQISLSSGSYIQISPTTKESLEISVISVNKNKIRTGEGSKLMNTVFDFCFSELGYRPRFVLECTGNLKIADSSAFTGIKGQTSFFRKFGFRVENDKHYPNYVMMSSPKSVTNVEEEVFQLVA
jgi:hypothetical protein